MKRLFGGIVEALHLLATAIVFASAFWLAPLTQSLRAWKAAALTDASAKFGSAAQPFLLSRGAWFAAFALFFAALAGFLRADTKRFVSVLRLIASGVALLATLWAAADLPAHRLPHAWNGVFGACAIVLLLTGFLVSGGKGGGAAKKKDDGEK